MPTDAEIADTRGFATHRSPYCFSLPHGCTCGKRRLTKDQVDAVWDGWVAEKPSRAAFFPITVHGSSSESGEDEKDSE
jgi:hypothetical protein